MSERFQCKEDSLLVQIILKTLLSLSLEVLTANF